MEQRHGDSDLESTLQNTLKQESLADVPAATRSIRKAVRNTRAVPVPARAGTGGVLYPLPHSTPPLVILVCIPVFAATSGDTSPRDATIEEETGGNGTRRLKGRFNYG